MLLSQTRGCSRTKSLFIMDRELGRSKLGLSRKNPDKSTNSEPEEAPRRAPVTQQIRRTRARPTHRGPTSTEVMLLITRDMYRITHEWKNSDISDTTIYYALDVLFRTASAPRVIQVVLARVSAAHERNSSSPLLTFDLIARLIKTVLLDESQVRARYLIHHLTTTKSPSGKAAYPATLMKHVADRMLEWWVASTAEPPRRSWFHRALMLDLCLEFMKKHRADRFGRDLDELADALACMRSFDTGCARAVLKHVSLERLLCAGASGRNDPFAIRRMLMANGALTHLMWVRCGPPRELSPSLNEACSKMPRDRAYTRPLTATASRRWSV